MARKKRGKRTPAVDPAPDEQVSTPTEGPTGDPPAAAPQGDEPMLDFDFDPAASERILAATAGIFSTARIAVAEATQATAPFLSFAQKSKVAALATDFEMRQAAPMLLQEAPAPVAAPAVVEVPVGEALSREDVEAIVSHRIEIAVRDALKALGLGPDISLSHQIERQVETQLAVGESRLLDYVKGHLTNALEMVESTLDERIADFLDGAAGDAADDEAEQEVKAEVDAAVEEVREALLKNIDEVRTVDVGFNLDDMDMSAIAGISDRVSSDGMEAIADDDLAVAMGDGEEIEVGGDDEIEVGGDDEIDEIEAGADDEIEVGGDDEIDENEAGADDEIEVGGAGEIDEIEAGADDEIDEIEAGGDDEIEAGGDEIDEAGETLDATSPGEDQPTESVEATEEADEISAELLELDDARQIDEIDLESVEELSIIESAEIEEAEIDIDDDLELESGELVEVEVEDEDEVLADALEIDLEDEEEDDNPAIMTLGEGPEDLQVTPLGDDDFEVTIEGEEFEPEEKDAIERYLQRAAEMRGRKQFPAAMELYNKVIDLDPANYEAFIGRGVLHLEGKDYKRAVEAFTEAEKIDPSRPASALGLAEVHFHRKQFNKAIRHYTQCLKLDDGLAQAYCNRGLSYYYQKNYKKAFLDLMRAYDIDADLPNIKKYLKLVRSKVKSEKSRPGASAPTKPE